jgi:branched-chain amino acid aminotransferase
MRALPTCYASRYYSVKLQGAASPKLAGLDSSKLEITKTTTPKAISKPEDLVFGREFTGTCVGRQCDRRS